MPSPAPSDLPRPAVRRLLSLVIAFHLLAVFLPPLAFQARGPLGSSPSVQTLSQPVRGYGEFLYLNRGYAFFAPDAGPSHLIQAAIADGEGNRVEQMIPDLRRHRPRLLYHRHFMLAEFLQDAYRPPLPSDAERLAESEPAEYRAWRSGRMRYEQIRGSIVDHLAATHPDHEVAIRRIEHAIPNFLEFNDDPTPLDDERFYNVLLDRPLEELPVSPEIDSPGSANPSPGSANPSPPATAPTGFPRDDGPFAPPESR